MSPGDRVRLVVPDNPRLDGRSAVITQLFDWGAYLTCEAAATGRFRAAWHEMALLSGGNVSVACGYTGDICPRCGSSRMKRSHSCLCCDDCGETSGCS